MCVERKTCTCENFQIDEISCPHAIVVLKNKNIVDMHPYCADYYKPKALSNTYEMPMVPIPNRVDWNVPSSILEEVIFPPKYKRMPKDQRKGGKRVLRRRYLQLLTVAVDVGIKDIINEHVIFFQRKMNVKSVVTMFLFSLIMLNGNKYNNMCLWKPLQIKCIKCSIF
ncbi:MAG: SWIM zinc finger family protein [Candidatus Phytoplasma australasiaticum]|nr:SWIM zinc finger family protein [Candidatus Phytoplasma australasiaticum]